MLGLGRLNGRRIYRGLRPAVPSGAWRALLCGKVAAARVLVGRLHHATRGADDPTGSRFHDRALMQAEVSCQLTEAGQGDVRERGQPDGSRLKAGLAEEDAAVSPNVLDDASESSDMQLVDGAAPALTLDNPQLRDTCLARTYNYIHVMLAPRACDALFDISTHAASHEISCRSLLVLPPC
jgi:hypothetical protein